MKAYLLFAGNSYYPSGGIEDYQGDFDSIDEAIDKYRSTSYDWYQVVQYSDMTECDSGWSK